MTEDLEKIKKYKRFNSNIDKLILVENEKRLRNYYNKETKEFILEEWYPYCSVFINGTARVGKSIRIEGESFVKYSSRFCLIKEDGEIINNEWYNYCSDMDSNNISSVNNDIGTKLVSISGKESKSYKSYFISDSNNSIYLGYELDYLNKQTVIDVYDKNLNIIIEGFKCNYNLSNPDIKIRVVRGNIFLTRNKKYVKEIK